MRCFSAAGGRSRISRVTGGDTNRYTTTDSLEVIHSVHFPYY